ncbi:hypothetical protein [Streptococcus constellatus]|uniref:hypothetical protein n=1 Tax=Streptococcus constellatus TaxID=76860 RepID=UPI000AFB1C6A|nr:hypothetical protein [Streptococcus constellatus]
MNHNTFIELSEQDLASYNGGEFPPPPYYSQALSPQALHARMTAWAYGILP